MRRYVVVAVLAAVVGALVATPIAVWAAHSFTDVPTSNIFHDDIDWLRDADVTRGCNPPANTRFCPDDAVSRGQMAAFLHRLSRNQVVDAGMLEGRTAAQLAPRVAFNSTESLKSGGVNQASVLSTQITAPARGTLIMSAIVDAWNSSNRNLYACWLNVDDGLVSGTYMTAEVNGDTNVNEDENCATTGAAVVDAGVHTVGFRVEAGMSTALDDASIWVMWVPLDGSGATPTSLTPLIAPEDMVPARD